MKMRIAHIVPLSTQAVAILRELQAVTGRDAIERQLAHGERNKIRAAYDRAEFLPA